MNPKKFGQALLAMAIFMVVSTAGLIWLNSQNPGFCPPYPVIGTPACIVMECYFALMLGALFIRDRRLGDIVFYAPALVAFVSASIFSYRDIMSISSCPQLLKLSHRALRRRSRRRGGGMRQPSAARRR